MADYIDREAAIEAASELYPGLPFMVDFLLELPAADVVERKRGEWIDKEFDTYLLNDERYVTAYGFYCSNCGKTVGEKGNFCPSCDSDMRKEVTDD